MLRITTSHLGRQALHECAEDEAVIGRSQPDFQPDIALDEDPSVTARHAQLWVAAEQVWIRPLDDSARVDVNRETIRQPTALQPGDHVQVGATTLQVHWESGAVLTQITSQRTETAEDPAVTIAGEINAEEAYVPELDSTTGQQLAMLYDLPLQFAAERDLRRLFALVLHSVINIIPGATRGALLALDRHSGKLALRASIPEDDPPISRTLIRRAAAQGSGFIWSKEGEMDLSKSMAALSISTGMYCPLMWQGEVMGVICVDTPESNRSFRESDLRFLIAVAHYAAAAISNSELQADIEFKNKVQERLLTNFSPRLRGRLVEQARVGELAPGGERSQVTLLMSDIRGFTNKTATMDVMDVVDMLNEYFTELVQAIFEHDGTIDKFIGDAILAVFGSPDKDVDQQRKAVRAAIAMQQATERVNERRRERGAVCCDLGIGLHFGEVLHGFIGAEDRLEFTVIGDTVNRTARYCDGAAKDAIVVSPELHAFVRDEFSFSEMTFPTKHEGEFKGYSVNWRTSA